MAIDPDTRQRAEELFIIDGLTLQEVAGQLAISGRTLANWSSEGEWVQRRREYQNAARDIKYYGKMTRLKLIKDAMTSLDPQKIYAFATLERTMVEPKAEGGNLNAETGGKGPDIEIKTPAEAIAALQKAINFKLVKMLEQPDTLDFKGVQDIQKAMNLAEEMGRKYRGCEDKENALENEESENKEVMTVDRLKAIIKETYGV